MATLMLISFGFGVLSALRLRSDRKMRKAFWKPCWVDAYLRPEQNNEPVSTIQIRAAVQRELMAEMEGVAENSWNQACGGEKQTSNQFLHLTRAFLAGMRQ